MSDNRRKVFNCYRIVLPDNSIGISTLDGVVTEAGSLVKFMTGWKLAKVIKHCKKEGWEFQYGK